MFLLFLARVMPASSIMAKPACMTEEGWNGHHTSFGWSLIVAAAGKQKAESGGECGGCTEDEVSQGEQPVVVNCCGKIRGPSITTAHLL